MLRRIESGPTELPSAEEVDVLVVIADRRNPRAAALIPPDRARDVPRYFMSVTTRARRIIMALDGEVGVIDAAVRLGALPEEILPPGHIVEVHTLLDAALARRAQEAAAVAALAAAEAEGSA